MATKKISGMTAATTPLNGTELLELSQFAGGVWNTVNATSLDVSYAAAKLGSFLDITDQVGSVSAATAVRLGTNDINTKGVTVVSDGTNLTRITYAAAGTYMISPSLQFNNAENADHDATVWLAKNGTAITHSATVVTIPALSDGGSACFSTVFYVTVAAGDYLQVMWLPENINVTLNAIAAGAIAPSVPSAIVVTERVSL